MLSRQNIGTLVMLGLFAEFVTFVAVVHWIGLGPALLLGLASTLLGLARLRGVGTAALRHLRAMAEGGAAREDAFVDGALGALGGALLVLPGFLSDLAGLALLAPSGRDWLRRRIGLSAGPLPGPRREAGPRTIDLEATDWSRLDRARPR